MAIMQSIVQACRDLSEGELMEIDNTERHSLDEDEYLQMIRKKTAMLISACAEIGALSAGATPETVARCRAFGEYFGYCFQIKDDIFDYFDAAIGKPTGNDIREGKITLPLLYTLNTVSDEKAGLLQQIVRNGDFSCENIQLLVAFAKEHGGIAYAESCLMKYKCLAVETVNGLPPSEARHSLLLLADYLIERTN